MRIKICGVTEPTFLEQVSSFEIDYLGFIFHPSSPRCVIGRLEPEQVRALPTKLGKVGVFVNSRLEDVSKAIMVYGLSAVQLHGEESPEYCRVLAAAYEGLEVIKAFAVDETFKPDVVNAFVPHCTFVLFDTKTPEHGGSGRTFDWSLLEEIPRELPFFLAGGLGVGSAAEVRETFLGRTLPIALDFNSRLESAPGVKDLNTLKRVIEEVRYEFAC